MTRSIFHIQRARKGLEKREDRGGEHLILFEVKRLIKNYLVTRRLRFNYHSCHLRCVDSHKKKNLCGVAPRSPPLRLALAADSFAKSTTLALECTSRRLS